jgi:O-antigen/teichoic acid export membrane protein
MVFQNHENKPPGDLHSGCVRRRKTKGTLARGSLSLFVSQLVGNAGFFAAVLLIARGLGPAGRGTTAFITVTSLVVGRLTKVGVTESTTVFAAKHPKLRATLLSNLLLFTLVGAATGAAVVCGGLVALGHLRPHGLGVPEIAILGAATVANSLLVGSNAFLLGCGRIRERSILTAAGPWIYALAVAVFWLTLGLSVARAALAWAIAEAIWGLALTAASLRGIGLGRPSGSLMRECIGFGIRAWLGTLANFANFRADQILMGFISSQAALGIYAVAVNSSEMVLYLPQATATALLPLLAGVDVGQSAKKTLMTFRSVILVTAVTVVIAAAVGAPLLPVVFGHAYHASVVPFIWLLPGAVGFAASIVLSNALIAVSRPGLSSLGPVVSLVLGIGADLVLIPKFGATGAAEAACAAYLAGGLVALAAYRRHERFAWRALVPGLADVRTLAVAARPLVKLQRVRTVSVTEVRRATPVQRPARSG